MLHAEGGTLIVDVTDDGAGFDVNSVRKGAVMANMSDRVDALGGSLEVMPHPGAGSCYRGTLPAQVRVAAVS